MVSYQGSSPIPYRGSERKDKNGGCCLWRRETLIVGQLSSVPLIVQCLHDRSGPGIRERVDIVTNKGSIWMQEEQLYSLETF